MTTTIIEVYPKGTEFSVRLFEPQEIAPASEPLPFPYCPDHEIPVAFQNGVGGVNEIGEYIMNALVAHPDIKEAIKQQLSRGEDEMQPLLIRVPIEAEGLPWETLFANESFLALDRRWPIARLNPHDGGVSRLDFQPPLRILAILAADEERQDTCDASEWKALLQALEIAKFPVAVKALVTRESLLREINDTKSRIVSAEAEFVPPGRAFSKALNAQKPHILHFFCHGLQRGSRSYLRVGTRLSVDGAGEPVLFAADAIKPPLLKDLWLATLNCCRSAKSGDGVGSLSFSFMKRGVPAVAGMRQAVSVPDANAFSRAFYGEVMRELTAVLDAPEESVEINWPGMLYEPRMDLAEASRGRDPLEVAAQRDRAWTLPALYLGWRSSQLVARRPAADTPGIGRVSSRVPPDVLGFLQAVGLRGGSGPVLSEAERERLEVKLDLFRKLVREELGAPSAVLDAYRSEIEKLELQLFGASAADDTGTEP
jgi:hypothetical protein